MAGKQYLTLDQGREKLIEGTQTSVGSADGGKIVSLNSEGNVDASMIPPEITRQNVNSFVATEALAPGKFVNVFLDAGAFKVRLADSSNDRRANGFVKAAVAVGGMALVYFNVDNTLLTGLTPGRVYLGAAGGIIQTVPTKPANLIHQLLGFAMSATEIDVNIQDEIVL